jgi:hypothetical protein
VAGLIDKETSAHPGEKLDTQWGKRNPGASANRCAIRDLEREASYLSRVRGDSPARFCGEGVIAISPPYPTTYGNTYAWFLDMRDGKVVNAFAFFDSVVFNEFWQRVKP